MSNKLGNLIIKFLEKIYLQKEGIKILRPQDEIIKNPYLTPVMRMEKAYAFSPYERGLIAWYVSGFTMEERIKLLQDSTPYWRTKFINCVFDSNKNLPKEKED